MATAPTSPPPELSTVYSLNQLRGHVSAVYMGKFLHSFDEAGQAQIAHALAGLNSVTGRLEEGAVPYHVPMSAHPVGSSIMILAGFGFISRMHGLSVDNVVEVEMVLADGRIVVVNRDSDPGTYVHTRRVCPKISSESIGAELTVRLPERRRPLVGHPRGGPRVRDRHPLQGARVPHPRRLRREPHLVRTLLSPHPAAAYPPRANRRPFTPAFLVRSARIGAH